MATPDFAKFGTLVDEAASAAPDFSKFGTPVDKAGKLFTFTSPEGRSYDVEGPAGSTKEQAFQVLQSKLANANAATPTKKRSLVEAGSFSMDESKSDGKSLVDDGIVAAKNIAGNAWDFAKDSVLTTLGMESGKSESTGGDVGRVLARGATVGVVDTVSGLNEMAKQTPLGMLTDFVTPTFIKQLRDSANDAVMSAVKQRGKTIGAGLTEESQASEKKSFFADDASWANLSKGGIANVPAKIAELVSSGKFFGEGWGDPRKIGLAATESVPVSLASMLPVIRASAAAHELALSRAFAAGATETEAKQIALSAAKNTASKAGALSEGGTGAGQQWTQTYQQVLDLPQAKLDQSPEYQDALRAMPKDWSPERRATEGRKVIAKASANTAAVVAGVADALFAGMGDRYIGGAVAGKGGRAKSIALGVAEETPTETLQSGAEQLGTNLGVRQFADPSQQLMADVGEQAVGGGLSGGLMGGVFGGAAHTKAPPPGAAVPSYDVLGAPEATAAVAAEPNSAAASAAILEPTGVESMLADPAALFSAVTARPAIFGTIEQAIKAMPEVQAAPPEKLADLAGALKEMEADPKAIFAVATARPDLYATIAKAAAQTEKLGSITPPNQETRSGTPVAESQTLPPEGSDAGVAPSQAVAAPAPITTPVTDVRAEQEAAYAQREAEQQAQRAREEQAARDQNMRDTYDLELARAEAANSGLRPESQVPKTALQLELERLGLSPDKFRKTEAPVDDTNTLFRRTNDAHDEALVSRLNARAGGDIRLAAPDEVPVSADAHAGVKIAAAFGKRVVFVHSARRFAGLVLPEDPHTIYVNARSTAIAPLAIIGHELLHTLRRSNEAIYKPLLARVLPLMKNVPEYRAWMQEALTAEGETLTDDELDDLTHEELIGDFLGDHFMDAKFWTEVFRGQERSWVEKVRGSIALALDVLRMRLSIGGKRGFGSEIYIKDVDAVRKAMAEAFNAWSKNAESRQVTRAHRTTNATPEMASREVKTKKKPSAGLQALQAQLREVKVEAAHKPVARPRPAALTASVAEMPAGAPPHITTDERAHEAATSPKNDLAQPTEKQKAAGNYALGHVRIAGLAISIENPEGSTRSGTDPNGKTWSVTMKSHYGFLRGTIGRDKDHIDVFVKPGTPQDYAGPVFVIDQRNPSNGHYDEAKVMLGWPDMPSAKAGYIENFTKGWDGIRAITRFDSPVEFRAWLDSADTRQPAAPAVMRAREDRPAPMWYSAFARKVEEKAPNTAAPLLWKTFIVGLKNHGVKQDEIQWSGVYDWLDLQQTKVTKQAVLDYLSENGVRVEEVMLGEGKGIAPGSSTKFNRSDLALPGGRNYRELLLTLPAGTIEGWRLEWPNGLPIGSMKERREADNRAKQIGAVVLPIYKAGTKGAVHGVFLSDHFDQPNILAHVRFNERIDSEGKKVLFLEEVQSDWGQAGRENGFGSPTVQPPSGPFVTKTDAWLALSLKRMIRYAAENGFDKVAWTSGEQQAARYQEIPTVEGEPLDHIEVTDVGSGFVEVSERSRGGRADVSRVMRDELSEVIGEVMAVRALDDLDAKKPAKYKFPEDFRPPSQKRESGMRTFYDQIVPNVANDVLKKLGGARVEKIDIPIRGTTGHRRPTKIISRQSGFDITPALRSTALNGLPLFARERTSPGYKFEPRLELEKQSSGDWMSPDGRYEILREADGYYARVDGKEIGWGRDYPAARAHLLGAFQADLAAGRIKNYAEAKAVLNRYTTEQRAAVIDVWEKIASLPGVFRFGHSESKYIHTIARDLGVDRFITDITRIEADDKSAFEVKFKDGTYGLLNEDASNKTAYLDASNIRQGGYGARLYQLALTWAANNKYVLVPDPNGLTLINTYRRTEQMLSAALRLGTTKYMRPHPDQGLYGWINDPSTQTEEDTNLALLFLASYENVMQLQTDERGKVIEELRGLRYNFIRERYENADGKPISAQRWMDFSEAHESRDLGLGSSTIQRAVLTQSILAEASHRSGKGLAALVRATPANAILENGHPLRDILYSRHRDPRSGQMAGTRGHGTREALRALSLGAARGAVEASRPVTFGLDAANRGIEAVIRLPAKLLVAPVTSRLYDRVVGIGRALAQKNPIAQEIAHGLVADYGLPEPYLDARQDRDSRIQATLRQSKHLIDQIASLTRAEARIAYLWMQESPSSATEAQLLAQLPEASRQTLAQMKAQIDSLGQEAVRLGLLTQESYDRNHQAYLHRTYRKHELENPGAAVRGQKVKSIRADAYRGRGLRDDVAASRLPGVTQGAQFNRVELRDPGSDGQLGKLKRVVYLPAGQPIAQNYATWRNDGVWEARWMPAKGGDHIGMWRDMSIEERERLGEIDEVRYAFARTMLATTRDIETGRFLDWVHRAFAKGSEEDVLAAGQRIGAAVDAAMTVKTFAKDEWVQVPQTYAQGTKSRKYGALAGSFIPGHIWNDIRSTTNFQSDSAVWRLYDEMLRGWKIAKTSLSPIVHANNIMSNFILADMADVGHEDIRKSLRTIIDAQRGNEDARAVMDRFYASGAEGGSQSMIELRMEIIEPALTELAREEDDTLATVSMLQIVSMAAHLNLRQSLAALAAKRATKLAAWPFKAMIDAYRSEDSVFRLAKFIKETAAGKTDREAGKEARVAFLDYSINAPWIQALRRGPLPFIAFSYRAIPLLIQAATKRPEKMMKYFAVGYALNALAYAILGGGGDEDKERKLMPDEKSGRALGVFYRMLRMPWNAEDGSPVFLDVRRWIPGGDIVDLTGSKSAIPLPQWLSVGGPLSLFIELAANKNLFTGKPIVKESDTAGEQMVKLADHLYKFITPNLPVPNPAGYAADVAVDEHGLFQSYSWKSIQAAITGEANAAGQPRDLRQALLSSVGVKIAAQPENVAKKNIRMDRDAKLREISEKISEHRNNARRGAITTDELRERIEKQNDKKRAVNDELRQRLGLQRMQ